MFFVNRLVILRPVAAGIGTASGDGRPGNVPGAGPGAAAAVVGRGTIETNGGRDPEAAAVAVELARPQTRKTGVVLLYW